jgi:hypothetical protein
MMARMTAAAISSGRPPKGKTTSPRAALSPTAKRAADRGETAGFLGTRIR